MLTARRELSEYARDLRQNRERRDAAWNVILACLMGIAIFALIAHTVAP